MSSCIYWIRNTATGKIYVGQAKDFKKRIKSHKQDLRKGRHGNRHLQSAWNKYGEDKFFFSQLHKCSIEDLDSLEQYYIDNLRPEYNIELIVGKPFKGRKQTLESRLKIKEKSKRKILIDHLGNEYESVNELARKLNVNSGDITNAIKNKYRVKGLFIAYKTDGIPKIRKAKNEKIKIFDNIGRVYSSLAEAARFLDCDPSDILSVINGKRSVKGLSFKRLIDAPHCFDIREPSKKRFSKPVIDQNGNVYESVRDATRKTAIDSRIIISMCKGERKTSFNNFFFCYKENGACQGLQPAKTRIKDQYGNVYKSLADAAKKLRINISEISHILRGDYNYSHGYSFKPLNDNTPFIKPGSQNRKPLVDNLGTKYTSILEVCKIYNVSRKKLNRLIKNEQSINGKTFRYLN